MATVAQHYMSPEDLAEHFGIPVASIYAWRYRGTGPKAFKIGRHVRYRVEDVAAWVEAQADPRRAS